MTYDQAFISDWLDSPQPAFIMRLQVMPDTLRKDDVASLLSDGSDYADLFNWWTTWTQTTTTSIVPPALSNV